MAEASSRRTPARFDYVVVGGGTAGAWSPRGCREDPDVTVCVLEAGPDRRRRRQHPGLDRWMDLLESGYDWDYPVEPQETGNSFMRHARAKVLGGCSSHNSCIAFWAPAEDLDEWAADGLPTGWSAADCFPLYRRLETNDAPGDHHGRTGPVQLRTSRREDPCGAALLEACAQAGMPTAPFNTRHDRGHRAPTGSRSTPPRTAPGRPARVAYLHPILGQRRNLEVRTGAAGQEAGLRRRTALHRRRVPATRI